MGKIKEKYLNMPETIRASIWFLFCGFLQRGISVITTPVFTRIMTTSEFGDFNVFTSWNNVISIFVTLNLFSGVFTQGLIKFENQRKKFSASVQSLCTFLCLSWLVVYLITQKIWNNLLDLNTIQMILMMIIIWTNAMFLLWSTEQRVKIKYKKLVLLTLLYSIFCPIISLILMIFFKDKVTARILGLAISGMVFYSGMFWGNIKEKLKNIDIFYWKYAIKFNIPLIPHYLSQTVLNSADRIMIGEMVGSSSAGIYSLAYSVSTVMIIFNTSFLQMLEPWLYNKIKIKEYSNIENIMYPSLIIIAGINLLLILFAPEVVKLFAPIEYYEAIWIIPSVAMSVFFMFIYSFFAVFEFYYEKTQYITIATLIGALINLIFNYLLIPIFGYYAAGYTTLLSYIFYAVFHYLSMDKICNESLGGIKIFNLKKILIITISFIILGFVFMLSYYSMLIRYIMLSMYIVIVFINLKKINNFIYNIKKHK